MRDISGGGVDLLVSGTEFEAFFLSFFFSFRDSCVFSYVEGLLNCL